jgi:hypothetical protein
VFSVMPIQFGATGTAGRWPEIFSP